MHRAPEDREQTESHKVNGKRYNAHRSSHPRKEYTSGPGGAYPQTREGMAMRRRLRSAFRGAGEISEGMCDIIDGRRTTRCPNGRRPP